MDLKVFTLVDQITKFPCKSIEVRNMPSGEKDMSQIELVCTSKLRTGSLFPQLSHNTTEPSSNPLYLISKEAGLI